MYPATIFNWHDLSEINVGSNPDSIDDSPLFFQVFSSDKGTEDLIEISGKNFDSMYGPMSFTKHGQSAIQAKNIIDAGGRLLAKRVVAEDSTLANLILIANVTANTSGSGVTVKWTSQSVTGCKTFEEVKQQALNLFDEANGVFPVIMYADNGRGVSAKSVRLNPDYSTSKTIGKTFYSLVVYEGASITERATVSFDPTVIYANTSYALEPESAVQINGLVIENVYEAYVATVAEALGIAPEVARSYDLVYGYTNAGSLLPGFTLDDTGVDLDNSVGLKLTNGTNGSFGTAPVGTTDWANAIADVFLGNVTDRVWDVDEYKIAAVIDANYPDVVKEAIAAFVIFREDCVFLRDYGLGLTTFLEIKTRYNDLNQKYRSRFIADYATSYQIKDPQTKKNIEVTCTYDIAAKLISHISENPYAPVCGRVNGFILPAAIKGTINFTPVITPSVNQKEAMEDIKVNYAIFEGESCILQTNYTTNEKYTQLTYLCNVIAIQRVLRAVRTACPKQRYSLSTGTNLNSYASAVNNVLSKFASNFTVLNFVYIQDDLKAAQKIFYASIQFAFLNWAQTEIFDIYAINNEIE